MHKMLEEAQGLYDTIVNDRRQFHKNPEVGAHLPQTTEYIMKRLREMGYEPEEICDSGVVATVGKPGGKVFLLRADTDALPMQETTGLPYASQNDYAHSCGHDTHAAMLLGAAQLLKNHEDELEGAVKLMFQPNEEGLRGAITMINAGLLENPKVDAAMAIHIASAIPCGQLQYGDGACYSSGEKYLITIKGKGGHGSSPEQCIDPITAACYVQLALQQIIAREIAGMDVATIVTGHLWSGEKENIIPEYAYMEGSIRTYSHEVRELLLRRVVEVAEGICKTFRCECKVEYPFGVSPNVNDKEVQAQAVAYTKALIGEENVNVAPPTMGCEDFAEVAARVPSISFRLGARVDDDSRVFSHHSPNVVFKEEAFPVGAAAYAHVAMEWLKNNK